MQSQQLTINARTDDHDNGPAEGAPFEKSWYTPRVEAFGVRHTSTGSNSTAEDGIFGS